MIIVEGILDQELVSGCDVDVVALTWEGRQKCRQRVKTRDGRLIGLALPTGTILSPGDVLYCDGGVAIAVDGVAERVFVLTAASRGEACLLAYHVGNLHRAMGFDGDAILVPFEPVLEGVFDRLRIHYALDERVFTGTTRQLSHAH